MIKTLVAALTVSRVQLFETAGAVATIVGLAQWSPVAGWIGAGAALLAKSFQWDTRDDG